MAKRLASAPLRSGEGEERKESIWDGNLEKLSVSPGWANSFKHAGEDEGLSAATSTILGESLTSPV